MAKIRGRRVTVAIGLLALAGALASCSSSGSPRAGRIPTSAPRAATPTTEIPARAVGARPSEGCSAPLRATLIGGQERVDLASGATGLDGRARWYLRHVPPSYTETEPMPVVIDLHGYMVGATIETAATGLGRFGDSHGFVTITPQGSGDPKFVTWDTAVTSADVRFIAKLLDDVERTLCVDTRRVFVAGYSQGAFMTSTLACALADRIAAVAPVAGIRDTPGCRATRAMPVIAFHGTADRDIAYTGGLGPNGLKRPAFDGSGKTMGEEGLQNQPPLNGAAIPTITTAWAGRNGCGTAPAVRSVQHDVTRFVWPCPAGADVELYRVSGGGHTWPGSSFTAAAAAILGRTTRSISANAYIWRFFQAHPLREH